MIRPMDYPGRLLAHRGSWRTAAEQNTIAAMERAFESGFGIETDLRDLGGELAISHDLITENSVPMTLVALSEIVQSRTSLPMLALNVKSDGLARVLDQHWNYPADRHFFFDMSWPQLLEYVKVGLPVAIRVSEWEPLDMTIFDRLGVPSCVWIDSFYTDWWLEEETAQLLNEIDQVAIVSPEIHGRDPYPVWRWFAERVESGANMYLCTDRPSDFLKTVV